MMPPDLKSEFESNGYLKVPQALEPEDLSVLIRCADRLIDEFSGKLQSNGQLKSDYRSESFDWIPSTMGRSRSIWTSLRFGFPLWTWTNRTVAFGSSPAAIGGDYYMAPETTSRR